MFLAQTSCFLQAEFSIQQSLEICFHFISIQSLIIKPVYNYNENKCKQKIDSYSVWQCPCEELLTFREAKSIYMSTFKTQNVLETSMFIPTFHLLYFSSVVCLEE